MKTGHVVLHPGFQDQIWSPALIAAQRKSKNREKYWNKVEFGKGAVSWKMIVVVAIIFVVILLFATGRIHL